MSTLGIHQVLGFDSKQLRLKPLNRSLIAFESPLEDALKIWPSIVYDQAEQTGMVSIGRD